MLDFIHNDPEFKQILYIVASNKSIDITLIELMICFLNIIVCSFSVIDIRIPTLYIIFM